MQLSVIKEIGNIAYIFGVVLIPVCGYFIKRLLDQYDASIKSLKADMELNRHEFDKVKERFDRLCGEHDATIHKIRKRQ